MFLGGRLSERRDRFLLRATQEREERRERLDACIEFLASFRRYRAMLLTEDPEVELPPGRPAGAEVAFIKNSREYSDAAQGATARLLLVEGGESAVVLAAQRVSASLHQLAVARGRQGPGALPDDVVERSRHAEQEFARVVQAELHGRR
ncbi:hypothetical protein GCM10020369_46290 [Cryptosporangium minutisporangium]|uniref:Uncharacterized protein n=1 Tax=Cryptosporangium minutisporangium TaxID=113569 RepID=A0ABP6T3T1_9ACTN